MDPTKIFNSLNIYIQKITNITVNHLINYNIIIDMPCTFSCTFIISFPFHYLYFYFSDADILHPSFLFIILFSI